MLNLMVNAAVEERLNRWAKHLDACVPVACEAIARQLDTFYR